MAYNVAWQNESGKTGTGKIPFKTLTDATIWKQKLSNAFPTTNYWVIKQ